MSTKMEATRKLLELQGFYDVADNDLEQVDFGLRVSPAICLTLVAIATVLGSANMLWALLPLAIMGGTLSSHPFDVVYNHGLRHWIKGPRLPRYPAPRHFACLLASVFIVAEALSFQFGAALAGQVIGGVLTATALVPVATGFCVPSFLYRLVTGKIALTWSIQS